MRPGNRTLCSMVLAAALLWGPIGSSGASVFLKLDVESLNAKAQSVLHARVIDTRSYWNDARTMIFTDVTLEVIHGLRGAADKQVVVRVPGGSVDGFTIEMIGAPKLGLGEEVVVFIGRWHDGAPMVEGYSQGVSRVSAGGPEGPMLRGGVADGLSLSDLTRRLAGVPGGRRP